MGVHCEVYQFEEKVASATHTVRSGEEAFFIHTPESSLQAKGTSLFS